jgi:hypothetical protein
MASDCALVTAQAKEGYLESPYMLINELDSHLYGTPFCNLVFSLLHFM